MIVLIGGEKGGSGKSTTATNLAVALAQARQDVLIVDADTQGTAARWCERRAENPGRPVVNCVQRTGEGLYQALNDLATRYSEIIVDAGGRDSPELRAAMTACDRIYVPVRPSQADLETLGHVDELLTFARSLRPDGGPAAYALLSMAPTHHLVSEAEMARAYLTEHTSLDLADSVMKDRKVYRDALIDGLGVLELDNATAKAEVQAFAEEVYG